MQSIENAIGGLSHLSEDQIIERIYNVERASELILEKLYSELHEIREASREVDQQAIADQILRPKTRGMSRGVRVELQKALECRDADN